MTSWTLTTTEPDPLVFRLTPGAVRTIGRATGVDFILDRTLVSRVHCRITANDETLTIEDLDSTNGTFVNGERVKSAQAKTGDTLRIGRIDLTVSRQP
jgi:pSer/pThr/pTyr-binding forkhead associated (FHA) protein